MNETTVPRATKWSPATDAALKQIVRLCEKYPESVQSYLAARASRLAAVEARVNEAWEDAE